MEKLFAKIRKKFDSDADEVYLIAGLGNPGKEYRETRHNVGFMAVAEIAKQLEIEFSRVQNKALITKGNYQNKRIILVKPQTFMNLSGQAIGALTRFYKVPHQNLLILYDDADLAFETIRLRPEGGSAGQKGMKSIIQVLGTKEFPRLRIGIGRPPGRMRTPDYVLQDFSKTQKETLPWVLNKAAEAALLFVAEGIEPAMNKFNQTDK